MNLAGICLQWSSGTPFPQFLTFFCDFSATSCDRVKLNLQVCKWGNHWESPRASNYCFFLNFCVLIFYFFCQFQGKWNTMDVVKSDDCQSNRECCGACETGQSVTLTWGRSSSSHFLMIFDFRHLLCLSVGTRLTLSEHVGEFAAVWIAQ